MNKDNIEKQIELEKRMTELSVEKFRRELVKVTQQNSFSSSKSGNIIISNVLEVYINSIKSYLDNYSKGKAIRSTIAASIIMNLGAEKAALISSKVLLNSINTGSVQAVYRAIGQALEDEFKMQSYKKENHYYYDSIQKDLNSRCAKAQRKKYITMNMFNKRLAFHVSRWSTTEKVQTGMILARIFVETTGLMEFKDVFKSKKRIIYLQPTKTFLELTENLNNKLEVLEPFFLPMVAEPKPWTDIFEGGYLSPYLKRNKVIKNNNKAYLRKLKEYGTNRVFEALNTIQNTKWQINNEVLDVVKLLWQEGKEVAGLPNREDTPVPDYPFPNQTKDTVLNEREKSAVIKWKADTYEIHKKNVATRSIRILTSQLLRIAEQFKGYEQIYFPYQMDFRGRIYPIPVLLHPQGSDLSKGLLRFARGKPITTKEAEDWFFIHGANMFGEDKVSYKDRVQWVNKQTEQILLNAKDPIENRWWTEADKPIQFLAWCLEFKRYKENPKLFETHIPIQLDGTCNGLQHYSALLRDETAGKAVNLINSDKPNDIYQTVADKLIEKLKGINDDRLGNYYTSLGRNGNSYDNTHIDNVDLCTTNSLCIDTSIANAWLNLGINRKLTKRPVMVLPYGGTQLSCREYITAYLKENYSSEFLWEHFKIGNNPAECVYKVSVWLSHYLWESIRETLSSAIIGMDYLKALARAKLKYDNAIEWVTPMGLLIHQAYQKAKMHEIKTELFGKTLKTRYRNDEGNIDKQRQLNGICPNFIHSLDASCLMLWLLKCKEKNIEAFMSVHDCYGTLAPDTAESAKLLREAFVEVYKRPILDDFEADLIETLPNDIELPEKPKAGSLDIEEVLKSDYFFN